MDFKIRIIFDRRKTATNDKTGTVEIEITQGRTRKRFSTGVSVLAYQWKNGMVVNHPDCVALNNKIHDKYHEMSAYFSCSSKQLASFKQSDLIIPEFEDWLSTQIDGRTDLAQQTLRQHRTMLESVRKFGKFKTFDDLTPENIMLWDRQLRQHLNKQTSVHDYHKRLKVYVNMAVKFGFLTRSPYSVISIPRGREHNIKYLTDEERACIENLSLTGNLAVARDMFVMSCYTGLAYCDLVSIRKTDIVTDGSKEFICGRRRKTESGYRLLILPRAKKILEKYDYNMSRLSNPKCNMYLKAIAAMIGLNRINLTFHLARHIDSFYSLKTRNLQRLSA